MCRTARVSVEYRSDRGFSNPDDSGFELASDPGDATLREICRLSVIEFGVGIVNEDDPAVDFVLSACHRAGIKIGRSEAYYELLDVAECVDIDLD